VAGRARPASESARRSPGKEAVLAPGLESATTASDGHAVVTVRGDIAADTATELWQHLSYLVSQGHQHIVLDVGGMVLIDSAGVEVLARVAEWTPRQRG
jgi:anti-anti-sigma factor